VQAIWRQEVAQVGGRPELAACDWAVEGLIVGLNPSYFAPYAFRVFQEVDPEHDWQGVVDSGYRLLAEASSAELGAGRSVGLPPDWVGLNRLTGELVPLQRERGDTTVYSYDAARTFWRVALDLQWSGDERARSYLQQAGFLREQWSSRGAVAAAYARDGSVLESAPSLVGTAGAVAATLTLDPPTGHGLHASQIVGGAQRDGAGVFWGDRADLYTQEWGWFATALYTGVPKNRWQD
jgi:endoglucanase